MANKHLRRTHANGISFAHVGGLKTTTEIVNTAQHHDGISIPDLSTINIKNLERKITEGFENVNAFYHEHGVNDAEEIEKSRKLYFERINLDDRTKLALEGGDDIRMLLVDYDPIPEIRYVCVAYGGDEVKKRVRARINSGLETSEIVKSALA